jgi:mono/diheme cytochrome c family protein
MSTLRPMLLTGILAVAALSGSAALAQSGGYPLQYGFGTTPSAEELVKFSAIPPDGTGLPRGKGSYAEGQNIFTETCAACHGQKLEGILQPRYQGDKLIGGRGTLASELPIKTVESYWPYATTLFDYVKRAMPLNAPGSLTDDQVYSVVAYVLGEAAIISKSAVMDAKTLPAVQMPNRNGFFPDPRPELELYR